LIGYGKETTIKKILLTSWIVKPKIALGNRPGKYVIDYYNQLGVRCRETIGTNKNDAMSALREKIEKNFNPETTESISTEMIFKDYANQWIEGKVSIKDATRVSYQGILNNHLFPKWGMQK
jgi:hypothetical protein